MYYCIAFYYFHNEIFYVLRFHSSIILLQFYIFMSNIRELIKDKFYTINNILLLTKLGFLIKLVIFKYNL